MFTPPAKAPHASDDDSPIQVTVGDFVEAKSDTSPRNNREGITDFVTEIAESNEILHLSVRY